MDNNPFAPTPKKVAEQSSDDKIETFKDIKKLKKQMSEVVRISHNNRDVLLENFGDLEIKIKRHFQNNEEIVLGLFEDSNKTITSFKSDLVFIKTIFLIELFFGAVLLYLFYEGYLF